MANWRMQLHPDETQGAVRVRHTVESLTAGYFNYVVRAVNELR
jgi:hypothetical protein